MAEETTKETILVKLRRPQPFEERIIRKGDLKKVHNIVLDEDLVWNADNMHTVDGTDFSEDLLDVIKAHKEFRVVGETAGKKPSEPDSDLAQSKVEGNDVSGKPAVGFTDPAKKAAPKVGQ